MKVSIGLLFIAIGLAGGAILATAFVGWLLWMIYRFLKKRARRGMDTVL